MGYWTAAAVLLLAILASGCSRESSFREVVRDQKAAFEEATATLKTITDEASMAEAREKLLDMEPRFNSIIKRAQALGTPSETVREALRDDVAEFEVALRRYYTEIGRVRALPGGAVFVESLNFGRKGSR